MARVGLKFDLRFLRWTRVVPGLDPGLTLFKPVGALFKAVGPIGLKRAPIGLKRALRCARASEHFLPLFKPIGVYPLIAVGGDRLLRDKE